MCVVAMAMIHPTRPNINGIAMCQNRSCAISECLHTANATIVAKTHGGAHKSKVTVLLYPSVAASVGK